jgi:uncharacterized low-complexity protein
MSNSKQGLLMKNVKVSALILGAMLFLGTTSLSAADEKKEAKVADVKKEAKAMKCGAGKCGASKKEVVPSKPADEKKAVKSDAKK